VIHPFGRTIPAVERSIIHSMSNEARPTRDASRVLGWLRDGVPITLLCDLVEAGGVHSQAILEAERDTLEPWWREHAYPAPAATASEGQASA
jgi:hypothetical protein